MALTPQQVELQSLTKLKKNQIALLKNGVRIERTCVETIDGLIISATVDRFRLAKEFLAAADKMRRMRPPSERNIVSRSYYCMYHAARAVAYLTHNGDDHEAHNDLYKGLPDDFPNVAQWRNALKDARLRRNEADYDPYPVVDGDFATTGRQQATLVAQFVIEAEAYLRARGCPV